MIFGCGIDIEETHRFDKHYFENGILSDLIYDLFTSKEIENFSVFGKKAFLKGFCFKEAFYKALNNPDFDFKDVEIIFDSQNSFEINTSKSIKEKFNTHKITEILADFQQTDKYVSAQVLLINKEE
jgi:phosphopantetheine--protein transferase-like protein